MVNLIILHYFCEVAKLYIHREVICKAIENINHFLLLLDQNTGKENGGKVFENISNFVLSYCSQDVETLNFSSSDTIGQF